MRKIKSFLALALLGGGVGLSVAGCGGGFGPGSYYVLALAFDFPKATGDTCGDATVKSDTFFSAGQFDMFEGASQKIYLDGVVNPTNGNTFTLVGTQKGANYSFSGSETQVTDVGAGISITVTDTATVSLTLNGDAVSGNYKLVETCTGAQCQLAGKGDCTITGNISGSRVEGVQLQHEL